MNFFILKTYNWNRVAYYLAIFILNFSYLLSYDSTDSSKVYEMPSVTVTSTRAEKRLSPVPFEELGLLQIRDLYGSQDASLLLNELPSTIVASQSGGQIGYTDIILRGFSQRRIAVYINGIPQNDPEDHNVYWINYPDIASSIGSIQVQRGAGLSNYGQAAMGGSVNLETSNFANEYGVKISTGAGIQEFGGNSRSTNHILTRQTIEINSGLNSGFAFYGRLSRINSFGYRDHSWALLNGYFLGAAYLTDNLTTQINIFGGPFSDALVYNGIPKAWIKDKNLRRSNLNYWSYDDSGDTVNWTTKRRPEETETFEQPHYEILNDWQVSDKLRLMSSLFYYTGTGYYNYDGAGWATADMLALTAESGFDNVEDPRNTILKGYVEKQHGGWIPRLIYDHGGGMITIGAEIRMAESQNHGNIVFAENLPDGYFPNFKFYEFTGYRDVLSIFAREQFDISDNLLVNIEGQLVHHTYAISDEKFGNSYKIYELIGGGSKIAKGDLFSISYLFFNPRAGINWNIDDEFSAFASIAYTSREPRMINLYNAAFGFSGATPQFEKEIITSGENSRILYDFDSPITKSESLLDIELGWRFSNYDYSFDANFYWMEYYDELVQSGQLDLFGQPFDINAPRSRHIGIEISGSALVLQTSLSRFRIGANATFSRNTIIEWNYLVPDGNSISFAENDIAGFPSFICGLRATYELQNLFISIFAKRVGKFRTDNYDDLLINNEALKQELIRQGAYYKDNVVDAYSVVNFDLNYTFRGILGLSSLRLQLQVFNLLNEYYAQIGYGREFYPAAERSYYFGLEMRL